MRLSFVLTFLAFHAGAAPLEGLALPAERLAFADAGSSVAVAEAVRLLRARVEVLGGESDGGSVAVRVGEVGEGNDVDYLTPERVAPYREGLKPFQARESYFLAWDGEVLYAAGLGAMGTVYAVGDLEQRLRVHEGRVYVHFPEWRADGPSLLFEKPAMETRGEYLNVGYDIPGITPHRWDAERWRAYIDRLVLARLNRFYFYLWNDTYTMYPGSALSARPLNRRIHEGLRDAIEYAHRRGLDVTYMMCPTFLPKDVWEAHPEYHADIEYAQHGFPAACSSAPGAWDLMMAVARSEMEWFKAADAIQVWFYDPGGCWCEKYGCKTRQAEILARQVKEFSGVFRQMNPNARVEYNLWPIWLWEERTGIRYRGELAQRVRTDFGGGVTAVGAPDNTVTLPMPERDLGFGTGVFLFGTNPESGYVFPTPHLGWVREAAQRIAREGYGGAFGHRLEAWTRYPGTHFMGQFLWNPEATPESVVRKYADWQTGDPDRGAKLAEALLLLDRLTNDGLDPSRSARMLALAREACGGLDDPRRSDLSGLTAALSAIDVLALSLPAESDEALAPYIARFDAALAESADYAAWTRDPRHVFTTYREFLGRGWAKSVF